MARLLSKEEILNYLQEQSWYLLFVNNMSYTCIGTVYNMLSELCPDDYSLLIKRAFNWYSSLEGTHFWIKINNDYCKWYFYTSHNLSKEKILEYLKSQPYYSKLKGAAYCYDREKKFEDFIDEYPETFFTKICNYNNKLDQKEWWNQASKSYSSWINGH